MSILSSARSAARHRQMTRLEMAAYIAKLEGQNTALTADNTLLERQLDAAGIELSGALDDLRVARNENLRLDAALTATNAELANATAVSQLPQHISTQPTPIVQRFETGPVLRAGASPLAVGNPGQVRQTTWGRANDDTQPLPKMREAS